MKRKILIVRWGIVVPLLFLLLASVGIAFAHSATSNPSPAVATAIQCGVNAQATNPAATPSDPAYVACGTTLYNTGYADGHASALVELGLGKNYCFFEGQYAVNGQTCNQQLPPPINNCSGVFKGGLLSPVLATSELGGFGTIYLFESNAGGCGAVWAAFHVDANSTHTVSAVTVADQGGDDDNQSAGAYLTLPRSASLNDWTSTSMIDYVPGHTYQASATVDGMFVTASFTIPV